MAATMTDPTLGQDDTALGATAQQGLKPPTTAPALLPALGGAFGAPSTAGSSILGAMPLSPAVGGAGAGAPVQPYSPSPINAPTGPATSTDPLAFSASNLSPALPPPPAFDPSNPYLTNGTPFDFRQGAGAPPAQPSAPFAPPTPSVVTPGQGLSMLPLQPPTGLSSSSPAPVGSQAPDAAPSGTPPGLYNPNDPAWQKWQAGASVADQNAAINASNLQNAKNDTASNLSAITGAGGAFATPAEQQNWTTGQMALNGFDASGKPTGGPGDTNAAKAIESLYGGAGAAGSLNPAGSGGALTTVPGQAPFGGAPATPTSTATRFAGGPGGPNDVTAGGATPTAAPVLDANGMPTGAVGGGSVSGVAGAPTGGATSGPGAGVSLTPTDPSNSLLNQTIAPGAGLDRFGIANNQLQSTIKNVLDPQFAADQTALNQYNFGSGRGVSGMNRTSQGNLALARDNQINQLASTTLNGALTGSIDDMYKNLGIAQQQQGFQAGQQQSAFGQAVTAQQLQDALTNSAFGRAQAQEGAGYANDPAQMQLILSQLFGNQAGQAGQAAGQLLGGAGQASVNNPYNTPPAPGAAPAPTGAPAAPAIDANGMPVGQPVPSPEAPWGYDTNGEPLTAPPFNMNIPDVQTTPSLDQNGLPMGGY